MTITLRQKAQAILREAGWEIPAPPVLWSPRMARCAGLFVLEKDARDRWHPEIRLSIPLLRRRDWPWPQAVCGVHGQDPRAIQMRMALQDRKRWGQAAFRLIGGNGLRRSDSFQG